MNDFSIVTTRGFHIYTALAPTEFGKKLFQIFNKSWTSNSLYPSWILSKQHPSFTRFVKDHCRAVTPPIDSASFCMPTQVALLMIIVGSSWVKNSQVLTSPFSFIMLYRSFPLRSGYIRCCRCPKGHTSHPGINKNRCLVYFSLCLLCSLYITLSSCNIFPYYTIHTA